MSALPPRATSIAFFGMSALGQKRTFPFSFDHLVGNRHHAWWNNEIQRFSRSKVDQEFVLRRLHNWYIGRLLAFENSSDVDAPLAICLRYCVSVSHQATSLGEFSYVVDRGYPILGCHKDNSVALPK